MRKLSRSRQAVMKLAIAAALFVCGSTATRASTVTACTALDICYCVNPDNRDAIDANVARIRQTILDERSRGKTIGYLSVPLSTTGGGYFGVNREVAQQTKEDVERRFGAQSVWILNPGAEGKLPPGASGADYMLMWTTILVGSRGTGEDFDFVYFVGPKEFARFFALTGESDFATIENYFDRRVAADPDFKKSIDQGKLTKLSFRNYYALKASVAFSYGSHDEWNIIRLLNEKRRSASDLGIANQLSVLFDGRALNPSDYEIPVSNGYLGRCSN